MALSRFNPGKPRRPVAAPDPRATRLCTEWVKEHGGNANFDQLFRMLGENSFPPDKAHLAVEAFMREAMMKRVKR